MAVHLGPRIGVESMSLAASVDRLHSYTKFAPWTFENILDGWKALETTSLHGTEYEPKVCHPGKRLDENDIFDACKNAPGAIHWYFSEEGRFFLCVKLIEETSKEIYTLRLIDRDDDRFGCFSSRKSFGMELYDAEGKKCDNTMSELRWYDSEMPGILDLQRLLKGEAVMLSRSFYKPEQGEASFSLAT